MDSAHEKLLKEFEAFEVDQVLKEVKEWSLDDREIREFGEALLEEKRKRWLVVKATQAARHTYVQQSTGTRVATRNLPPSGSSRAWTIAAPIGGTNLNGP